MSAETDSKNANDVSHSRAEVSYIRAYCRAQLPGDAETAETILSTFAAGGVDSQIFAADLAAEYAQRKFVGVELAARVLRGLMRESEEDTVHAANFAAWVLRFGEPVEAPYDDLTRHCLQPTRELSVETRADAFDKARMMLLTSQAEQMALERLDAM